MPDEHGGKNPGPLQIAGEIQWIPRQIAGNSHPHVQ
jgi:hypothetical protein